MNEVEYLMKNYGDLGGCYRRITPSEVSIILHMIRKPNSLIVNYSLSYYNYSLNMLISIDVTFIFDSSVRVGLFSSAKILQLADVALRVIIPLKHLK